MYDQERCHSEAKGTRGIYPPLILTAPAKQILTLCNFPHLFLVTGMSEFVLRGLYFNTAMPHLEAGN